MGKKMVSSTMNITRDEAELEVDIAGEVFYYTDNDYGSDADENRGISKTFITDIADIEAFDSYNGKDIELTSDEQQIARDCLSDKFFDV